VKPRIPLTDPAFRYTPSASTDLRKLFARIKRDQRAEAERQRAAEEEAQRVVRPITKAKGKA
jgi:hypothetical protein